MIANGKLIFTGARWALRLVPKLGLIVASMGISLMVILILAEIVSTKLFNLSLPYVLEYSEYMVPIIVFWGGTYTMSKLGHVRADIIVNRLSVRTQELFYMAGYVLGLIFLAVVFTQLIDVASRSFQMNRLSFYPTPSPLGPPQMFAAVGLGLFVVQVMVEIGKSALRLYLLHKTESRD